MVEEVPAVRRTERISSEGLRALRAKWWPGGFLGAAVLLWDDDGRVLLVRHRDTKALLPGWSTPGGSPLPGETPEECVRREVMEEVGMEVEDLRLSKVLRVVLTDGLDSLEGDFYQYEGRARGHPRPGREVVDLNWFDNLPGDMAYREDYLDIFRGRRA